MSLQFPCSKGCGRSFKHENLHSHEQECDSIAQDDEDIGEYDNQRFKNILFVVDRTKPEILRYDSIKRSRIKISVVFTKDPTQAFPSLFQFVFFRAINRMFVVGGSNSQSNKVEKWNVLLVRYLFITDIEF
jgi:hypothetical protein